MGTLELLPSEYAETVERGRDWLKVYEPCGTAGCESPTCQLAYAIRRAIGADEQTPSPRSSAEGAEMRKTAAARLAAHALVTHKDWDTDAFNVRDEFDRLVDDYIGEHKRSY